MQATVSARDAAAIAGLLAMSATVMGDTEPLNESFPGETIEGDPSGVIIAGQLDDRECGGGYGSLSVGLPAPPEGDCPMPDTLMRAWVQFGLTVEDDNSSPLGDGFASALYGATPYYDFDYGLRAELQITGAANTDWIEDYPHGEIGRFEGFLTWRDIDGNSLGTATFENTFSAGMELFGVQVFGVPDGTETYDVELNNDACQPSSCERPDTFLGLFGESGAVIATDDDSSWAGNGFASMVSEPLAGETLLEWKVTGSGNESFTPGLFHGQLGGWAMQVEFYGPDGWMGGPYIDDSPFVAGDEVFSGLMDVPQGADFVEIWIDNAVEPCPCDIDFYTVTGLTPNGSYELSFDAQLWAMVAWLDASGLVENTTEWEPMPMIADDAGVLRIAVTGGEDWDLMGWHFESGPYTVTIAGEGPAPCNPADLSEPHQVLDLSDINAFVSAFVAADPLADLNPDGIYDLADIVAFIDAFNAGCPT